MDWREGQEGNCSVDFDKRGYLFWGRRNRLVVLIKAEGKM
jgi:hypothetical protein